jgi:antitoxin (DNA-binding transcriptional repressor) of toxin-antitoxin stability system
MEVPITQFRRKIFELINQAMAGAEIWVTHKGRRFRIVPDGNPNGRLSRVTQLEVINRAAEGSTDQSLQAEMVAAWERDWSTL